MAKDEISRLFAIPIILIISGILLFIYGYIALAPMYSTMQTPLFPLFALFMGIILIPIGVIGLIFLKWKKSS